MTQQREFQFNIVSITTGQKADSRLQTFVVGFALVLTAFLHGKWWKNIFWFMGLRELSVLFAGNNFIFRTPGFSFRKVFYCRVAFAAAFQLPKLKKQEPIQWVGAKAQLRGAVPLRDLDRVGGFHGATKSARDKHCPQRGTGKARCTRQARPRLWRERSACKSLCKIFQFSLQELQRHAG